MSDRVSLDTGLSPDLGRLHPDLRPEGGLFANGAAAWVQDSFLARSGEEAILRLQQFGRLSPPGSPGFNPFDDPARFAGYEDSIKLFRDARSEEEVTFIKGWIDRLREREDRLSRDAGVSRFLAAMLNPESLLTMRVATLAAGSTRLAGAARSAAATGAFAGGMSLAQGVAELDTLPGGLQHDLMTSTAMSAAFGAVLGGAFGYMLPRRAADGLGARHAAAHGAYEGRAPEGAPAPSEPLAPGSRPAETPVGREGAAPGPRLPDDEIARQVDSVRPQAVETFEGDQPVRMRAPPDATERPLIEPLGPEPPPRGMPRPPPADEATMRPMDAPSRVDRGLEDAVSALEQKWAGEAASEVSNPLRAMRAVMRSANDNPGDAPISPAVAERLAEFDLDLEDLRVRMDDLPSPAAANDNEQAIVALMRDFLDEQFNQLSRLVANDEAKLAALDEIKARWQGGFAMRSDRREAPTGAANENLTPEQMARELADALAIPPPPADAVTIRSGRAGPDAPEAADAPAPAGPASSAAPYLPSGETAPPAGPPPPGGAGPAAVAGVPPGQRLAPGAAARLARWAQTPFYLLANNRFVGAMGEELARLPHRLVQTPGLGIEGNVSGVASATDSVEAMTFARHAARYVEASRIHDEAYFAYRGWNENMAGPFTARAVELGEGVMNRIRQRPTNQMSASEFEEAVFQALENPSAAPVPEVGRAAQVWRDLVLDPMGEEAARHGIVLMQRWAPEARAALDQQDVTLAQLSREAERVHGPFDPSPNAVNHPIWRDLILWGETIRARRETLDAGLPDLPTYVPHRYLRERVKEDRAAFVRAVADWWTSGNSRRQERWAHPLVRAEIATANALGEGSEGALVGAIRGHLMARGMDESGATAIAMRETEAMRKLYAGLHPGEAEFERLAVVGRVPERMEPATLEALQLRALARQEAERTLRRVGMISENPTNDEMQLLEAITPDPNRQPDFHNRALPGHSRERSIDVPASVLAPWLDQSTKSMMADYMRNMGAAIEMSRQFGDPSMIGYRIGLHLRMHEAIQQAPDALRGTLLDEVPRVLQATDDLRDKVLGRFVRPETADAWSVRTLRLLQNHAILTSLGRGLQAAVIDAGRLVMEHGFRGVADAVWQRSIDAQGFSLARREARLAGAATELVLLGRNKAILDLERVGADRTLVERAAAAGTDMMMFVNLMAPWTQLAQEWAGAITQHEIVDLALKMRAGRASQKEVARMALLGFDPADATRIADSYDLAGRQVLKGGLRLMNSEAWTDFDMRDRVRSAIKTSVDSQVIKPGLADRPNFMSAPLAQALLLYKGFAIASTQRTLMAGLQRRDGLVLQGMMASVAIAWFMQSPAGGDKDKNPIFNRERMMGAIERSGVLGIIGDLNQATEILSMHHVGLRPLLQMDPPLYAKRSSWADMLGAVLGPTASPWLTLAWATTSKEAKSDELAGAIRRMIWFQNLLWVEGVFRALSREAGTFMHSPSEPAPPRQSVAPFARSR